MKRHSLAQSIKDAECIGIDTLRLLFCRHRSKAALLFFCPRRNLSVFANALCDSGLTREELAELRALLEEEKL